MVKYFALDRVEAKWPWRPSSKCELTEAALSRSSFCQIVSVL